MGATGKSGKLKKTSPTSYSTTGTTPKDWGVDTSKPPYPGYGNLQAKNKDVKKSFDAGYNNPKNTA